MTFVIETVGAARAGSCETKSWINNINKHRRRRK